MAPEIWRDSAAYALFSGFLRLCRGSLTARFLVFLAVSLRRSWSFGWLPRAFNSGYRGDLSLWGRFCACLNELCRRIGGSAAAQSSLLAGLSHFSGRALAGSFSGSLLRRAGTKRILLVIFSLYLPLDIFLRAFLPYSLASLWDKLLLVIMFAYVLFRRADARIEARHNPVDAPLILFIAVGFMLMLAISPDFGIALTGYRAVAQYALFFFIITRLAETKEDAFLVYKTLILVGFALALHGIYQFIAGTPMLGHWTSYAENDLRTRVFSIVKSPNILGDCMVMFAPLALGWAYFTKKRTVCILCWGICLCMCATCVFTFTRGAWIGLTAAALVFILLCDRRLLLFVPVIALVVPFVPGVSDRIAFLFTPEYQEMTNKLGGRNGRWEYAINLVMGTNPVFGFGLGRFGGAVAMQNQVERNLVYFYTDNYYVKTLTETGILGLTTYIALLLGLLWNSLRAFFRRPGFSPLLGGLTASMVGVLSHSFFENIFEVPYMNAYFWGIAALSMVLGFTLRDETVHES